MDDRDLPAFVRIGGDEPEAEPAAPAADPAPAPVADQPQPEAQPAPEGGAPPEGGPAPAQSPAPGSAPAADDAGKPPPGYVPLSALHGERRRADELQARLAALQQPPQAQPQPMATPDPDEDPEAYRAWEREQDELVRIDTKMHASEALARARYGDDLVNEVQQAAATRMANDPAFAAKVKAHPQPYMFVVADYQQWKTLQTVGNDPDAFAMRRAAELGFVKPINPANPAPAPAASTAAPQNPVAPRSIAAAPSAASPTAAAAQAVGGEATYERMFRK